MATIEDVAQAAGVSVATVSRVLNGKDVVRPETVEKVRAVIAELAYAPNLSARNLRKNESMVIMVIAPNFTNPFYAHILAGIGDAAQSLGYSVFICNSRGKETDEMQIDNIIKWHRADGIILLASAHNAKWLQKYANALPIVQCCEYANDVALPYVAIDNYQAAYSSVQYLISLKHKRIATISARNSHVSTKLRLQGYCDALRDAGIERDPSFTVYASKDYTYVSGYAAAEELFSKSNPPTAIFCISDILALSAIAAAVDSGMRVPEDVSVMGFDDVDYTTMFHPHISTIEQPCYELGTQSMHLLHAYKQKFPQAPSCDFLRHKLIIRESTKSLDTHEQNDE